MSETTEVKHWYLIELEEKYERVKLELKNAIKERDFLKKELLEIKSQGWPPPPLLPD